MSTWSFAFQPPPTASTLVPGGPLFGMSPSDAALASGARASGARATTTVRISRIRSPRIGRTLDRRISGAR
jgi:hypothetical protein